jgi:hypothetical protein
MTELYRGLLEILVKRCIDQIEALRTHIRSHNSGHTENFEVDIGVTGFWNLMLETIFTIFSILFLLIGVSLAAIIAVISYPLAAWINYGIWLLKTTRNPEKTKEEQPKIIKKESNNEL